MKSPLRVLVPPRRRRIAALLSLAACAGACSKNINIAPQADALQAADAAAPPPIVDASSSPPAQPVDSGAGDSGAVLHTDTCTFVTREPATPFNGDYDLARWRVPPPAALADAYDTSDPTTVLDKTTGLTWSSGELPMTYVNAAASCANRANMPSEGAWRLPRRIELLSLLAWEASNTTTGLPSVVWVPGGSDATFWSGTLAAGVASQRWVVDFTGTGVGPRPEPAETVLPFLCVRDPFSGLSAHPAFSVAADCGVVRDDATELEWQRDADPLTFETTAGVTAYCSSLALGPKGGRSGWRAPTLAELFTIVDTTRTSPALDPALFPGAATKLSSATMVTLTGTPLAAALDTGTGVRASLAAGDKVAVRCVREAL